MWPHHSLFKTGTIMLSVRYMAPCISHPVIRIKLMINRCICCLKGKRNYVKIIYCFYRLPYLEQSLISCWDEMLPEEEYSLLLEHRLQCIWTLIFPFLQAYLCGIYWIQDKGKTQKAQLSSTILLFKWYDMLMNNLAKSFRFETYLSNSYPPTRTTRQLPNEPFYRLFPWKLLETKERTQWY